MAIVRWGLAALALCVLAAESGAAPLLFNTGVDATGNVLPDLTVDTHYALVAQPAGGTFTAGMAKSSATGFPVGPWLGDTPASRWLIPSPGDSQGNGPPGTYAFRTTFALPANVVGPVRISGNWSSDNEGQPGIFLNGAFTGNSVSDPAAFTAFHRFDVTAGFQAGVNTLEFRFTNDPSGNNPTGFRVEGMMLTAGVSGLFNTGVSDTLAPLANGATDPHYTISGAGGPTATAATSAHGFPIPPWLGDDTASDWIAPSASTNGPAGDYVYTTSFVAAANGTVTIDGFIAADNAVSGVSVNGVPGTFGPGGFTAWTPFSVTAPVTAGSNTLSFTVTNFDGGGPNPTGLRVEIADAILQGSGGVPEPGTLALFGVGLAGLSGWWRGRRGRRIGG